MTRPVPKQISRPELPGLKPLSALELNKTRVGLSHTLITPTLITVAGKKNT